MTFNWSTDPNRLIPFDSARAEDVNAGFDGVTTEFNSVTTKTNAAIKVPDGETANPLTAAAVRRGKVLTFNATTGQPEAVIATVDVATVAGIAGDVTTVSGISANVTAVANNNANVTTVAGISGNVTTVAGISTNVTTVATNNANVTTCATNMAAIIAAPTQASNAAASASAAAASYDSFDDRYLGPKASDPTLDNDGNALLEGAIYWNSTSKEMRVYNGSVWVSTYIPAGAYGLLNSPNTWAATQTFGANIAFTGTGNRITGEFSNATVANRVMFQSSTTNGQTGVTAIPNGTSTTSFFQATNSSDPSNSSQGALVALSTEVRLQSAIFGTGTYLPMTFYTGGAERLRIDTSGNLGVGRAPNYKIDAYLSGSGSPAIASSNDSIVTIVQSVGAAQGNVGTLTSHPLVLISGNTERLRIDTAGNLSVGGSNNANTAHSFLSGNAANYSVFGFGRASIDGYIGVATAGAFVTGVNSGELVYRGTAHVFGNNSGTLNFKIDTSGNVTAHNPAGGLGYGTGAGGTVTQATSRTTGVTLSKPTGAITLFTAAGSVTATSFTVTNTLVAATDTIVLSVKSGTNKYLAFVTAVAAGSFEITFYTTGGTASDAPVINFAVLKGVTA